MLCCNCKNPLLVQSSQSSCAGARCQKSTRRVLSDFLQWLFCNSDCPTWGFGRPSTESGIVLSLNRCDADPSALANYVVALVKKDKPEKELKAFCADQLDVFLQKGTVLSTTSSVRWFSFHWGEEEG